MVLMREEMYHLERNETDEQLVHCFALHHASETSYLARRHGNSILDVSFIMGIACVSLCQPRRHSILSNGENLIAVNCHCL